MQTEFFSISGVWILEFFFVIVFNRRALWLCAWLQFLMNRPLGFSVFFVIRGLFAMSGVWSFGFQSIQIITYACVSISVPKKEDSSVWVVEGERSPLSLISLSLDIVPSTYEVYFSCLAFGFLCISSWLCLARPMFFCDESKLGFFFVVFGFFLRYPVFGYWVDC